MWKTIAWTVRKGRTLEDCKRLRDNWVKRHGHNMQYEEIVVCNGYGFEYRPLRQIH